MTPINQLIHSLPITPSLSDSIPEITPDKLTLSQPIKVTGQLNTDLLLNGVEEKLSSAVSQVQKYGSQCSQSLNPLTFQIGVDEVGRGPLYGSVVVAATILPNAWSGEFAKQPLVDTPLATLNDSKKLTETRRERLYPLIQQNALGFVLVEIPAMVIDTINIYQATMTGMRLACEQLIVEVLSAFNKSIKTIPSSFRLIDWLHFHVLIDGNKVPEFDWQRLYKGKLNENSLAHDNQCSTKYAVDKLVSAEAIVKGDAYHSAIAAASVLAKVYRDRQLCEDAARYPDYGLEKHKGYPTKAHIDAIHKYGVLPQHRRSFKPIKSAIARSRSRVNLES